MKSLTRGGRSRSIYQNLVVASALVLLSLPITGCGKKEFISLGTAPPGGAFQPVGNEITETLNANKGDNEWTVQSNETKGSQENIRRLADGELQLALSNSAITFFAVNGGGSWDKEFEMRTIVTIAPNVAFFITTEESGIRTMADLKGRKVVIGPAGAGFEMFVEPLLNAHGLSYDDLSVLNNSQMGAVDMLKDGKADAAFLGGAIPAASIQRACSEMNVHFIPLDPDAMDELVDEYLFFQRLVVKAEKYDDLENDFPALNVGSMHLITSSDFDEDKVYEVTKIIWENRESIDHPASMFINENNAARNTGTPFHPGAIRFYKEINIWPEDEADDTESDTNDADTNDADSSDTDDSDTDDESENNSTDADTDSDDNDSQ